MILLSSDLKHWHDDATWGGQGNVNFVNFHDDCFVISISIIIVIIIIIYYYYFIITVIIITIIIVLIVIATITVILFLVLSCVLSWWLFCY